MSASKEEQLDKFISDLWVAMTRLIKRPPQIGGHLAEEHGLTPPQIFTLWQLKENGPMTMGQLSELLSVTHGVATRMVDRLLKKGMVERHRDENDRRVVLISLTRLGARVSARVVEAAMSEIRSAFKNVSQRDREEFLALLGRIEEAQISGSGE
jgi:DNA-binding MarR family transcriptional regulator